MANIEQQPERPQMDHKLLEALTNRNAFGILQLVNPEDLPMAMADQIAVPMPYQEAPENALQGVTSDGDGVLHIAARFEYVELVRAIFLRCRNAVDVTAKNKRGETALHCAAATGNDAMIDLLIRLAGARDKKRQLPREQNDNGETCLHEAVRFGNSYAVQRLVEQDVDVYNVLQRNLALVEVHDKEGVSPLYLATTSRQLEIVKFLAPKARCANVQYPAASYAGPGGKTALHAAVLLNKELSGHLAEWKKELTGKADVSGSTPLHLLASTKDTFIMKLLLDLDKNAGYHADNEGSLPIHVASANGSLGIIKLLSELCPSCSWSCNNTGQTILHIAVQNGKGNVVKYVCSGKKFARIINTRDIDGNSALHLAVLEANQSIFCRLMRNKEVCLSITNKKGHTPLDVAQLSLPQGTLMQAPRHWILYALVLAGADYGTFRSDHLSTICDKEKESKSIGKSAGLVAVCSVLILTTAFAAPFSVTKLFDDQKRNDQKKDDLSRAFAYRIFVISDALAFAFSALTISFSTLAGFHFTDMGTRQLYLVAGVAILFLAAMSIMVAFTAGLYVAIAPVVNSATIFSVCLVIAIVFPIVVLPLTLVFRMGIHAWSLLWRLFPACFCGMICLLPRWRRERVPRRYRGLCMISLSVVFLTFGVCGLIILFTVLSRRILKIT